MNPMSGRERKLRSSMRHILIRGEHLIAESLCDQASEQNARSGASTQAALPAQNNVRDIGSYAWVSVIHAPRVSGSVDVTRRYSTARLR